MSPLPRQTFAKAERLCSRSRITSLFHRENTRQASRYPLSVSWSAVNFPTDTPAQVLFSVPKRKWKRAHDRNRIRRQMREAWRLQKQILYDSLSAQRLHYAVVMVYTAQETVSYHDLYHACGELLEKIAAPHP